MKAADLHMKNKDLGKGGPSGGTPVGLRLEAAAGLSVYTTKTLVEVVCLSLS